MIIRAIDAAGDWEFGKGLASYNTGEAAIDENIKTRLLSWVGDCFFAAQEGVDWRSRLEVGQEENLKEELKSVILQSFGVVGLNTISFDFNHKTRLFNVQYDITTIYSQSFQSQITMAAGTGI